MSSATRLEGPVVYRWLGSVAYQEGLKLQNQTADGLRTLESKGGGERVDPPAAIVYGLEHPSVITLGIRSDSSDLAMSPSHLSQLGIEVVHVRRGGQTTAHNPGQLVIYPIVRLDRFRGLGVREFVGILQSATAELLASLGLQVDPPGPHPGVWSSAKKIASIGIQVTRGVTLHGVAINVRNDLGLFQYFAPCGLSANAMTSIECETRDHPLKERLHRSFELEQLFKQWVAVFERLLTPYCDSDYRLGFSDGSLGAVGSAFP